ncbi:MAG: GSCFA domain-containing protein, partial [Cyclobacteriaceae bacterium]|nr:GSCFA domain-containing protein [Cyclobacteriaceae bacterium]
MQGNSFRTEISIARGKSINLKDRILTTGSCFAQQFGDWLASNKLNVLSNPFGTTYNPISIHENLADSLANRLNESLFFEADAMWKHFNYHSQWWASDKQSLTNTLQAQQNRV